LEKQAKISLTACFTLPLLKEISSLLSAKLAAALP